MNKSVDGLKKIADRVDSLHRRMDSIESRRDAGDEEYDVELSKLKGELKRAREFARANPNASPNPDIAVDKLRDQIVRLEVNLGRRKPAFGVKKRRI